MLQGEPTGGVKPRGVHVASEAALTVGVFVYLWLVVDPSLQFEAGPWFPAFARGREFAEPFLRRPGGPAQYISAWLAQYHYWAWAGAAISAAIGAALMCASRGVVQAWGARPRIVHLVPPVLVVVLCNQYGFHLAALVSLMLASASAALYVTYAPSHPAARAAVLVPLFALTFYVCGAPFITMALICGLFEPAHGRRLLGLIWLMAAEAVPYVGGVVLAGLEMDVPFARLTPFERPAALEGRWALLGLFAYLPLLALWLTVWPPQADGRLAALWAAAQRRLRPALRTLPVLALLAAPVAVTFRGDLRANLRIDRFVRDRAWERVLQEAAKLDIGRYTVGTGFSVNRALLALGRLSDEMFRYPQAPEGLMLGVAAGGLARDTAYSMRLQLFFAIGDSDLMLGMVNDAEHECHEALEVYGEHAVTLRRLALVNMVKGQAPAARQFLRALCRNVIYDAWARRRLTQLEADPGMSRDPEVRAIREVMLSRGPDVLGYSIETRCKALLQSNPQNRAAFELLMAGYLLHRRLDEFVQNLPRLDALGYHAIPRHFQEAILLYELEHGTTVDLGSHWIDPATQEQCVAFCRLIAPYQARGNLASAQALAAPTFGNTYFYYHLYGRSGVGRR